MKIDNFHLYTDSHECAILKDVLQYLPEGEVKFEVAVYTTTSRYGIVLSEQACRDMKIILLNNRIFPIKKFDPAETFSRFLTFTFLHECAHITGIERECDADDKAMEWHHKYVQTNLPEVKPFALEEKNSTEDIFSARDYIFVSNEGDVNDYVSALVGETMVNEFISRSKGNGGITAVLKSLIRDYLK